jgi:hypothetical protein
MVQDSFGRSGAFFKTDIAESAHSQPPSQAPAPFSGMKIVSSMVAALQQFMPGADVGIDLSKEYAAVKGG